PRLDKVRDERAGVRVADNRARWDRDDQVRAAAPGFVTAAAVLAVLGVEVALLGERDQRVDRRLDLKVDIATLAAVAARRAATRNVFLAAEVHDAVAAVAALYLNCCFIICHDAGV